MGRGHGRDAEKRAGQHHQQTPAMKVKVRVRCGVDLQRIERVDRSHDALVVQRRNILIDRAGGERK